MATNTNACYKILGYNKINYSNYKLREFAVIFLVELQFDAELRRIDTYLNRVE